MGVRLIPFNVVIPAEERDPNLIEKLQAERPGILAWSVRGCLEQLRDGMNPPAEVMLATEEYRQESDELTYFIAACCIEGAEILRVTRAELYATYLSWAKRSNERPMDRNALYEAIRRRDGIQQGSWTMDGKAVRGFSGIALAASLNDYSSQVQSIGCLTANNGFRNYTIIISLVTWALFGQACFGLLAGQRCGCRRSRRH